MSLMGLVLSTTWWMFPMDCLCICSRSCFGFTYVGEMSIHVVLNTCYISRSSTCKWFVSLYYTISPTFQVSRMVIVVQCIMVRVTICTSRWWWWSWVVWLLWESFSIFAFLLGDVVDTIKKVLLDRIEHECFFYCSNHLVNSFALISNPHKYNLWFNRDCAV